VLIGNPLFALGEQRQRLAVRSVQKSEGQGQQGAVGTGLRSREQSGAKIAALPGTKVELDAVAGLLQKGQWKVETLSEANALEESVKRVKGPRVLHLATHGFFFPDQEASKGTELFGGERSSGREDPMVRSGLIFSGAQRVFSGEAALPDLEDGVLTAYEAMSLNLQGTELVTLSACETGLGQVKAGEGVFGLRRAFEVAGADAVLMSLWAVPDRETQELMTLFYGKWLAGKGKHEALRQAQLEMRDKVKARYSKDLPYYWGAFVLVGR
jgi:CHAT domain-containing protein